MTAGICECGCGQPTRSAPHNDPRKGWLKGSPMRYVRGHHLRKSPVEFVIDNDSGCWLWSRAIGSHGYGVVAINNRRVLAHRLFFERAFGEISEGKFVLHRCDNRRCVNPEHLFLGTHRDNMADMKTKGRSLRGEKNPRAKLSDSEVSFARAMRRDGALLDDVAAAIGVSSSYASVLCSNKARLEKI